VGWFHGFVLSFDLNLPFLEHTKEEVKGVARTEKRREELKTNHLNPRNPLLASTTPAYSKRQIPSYASKANEWMHFISTEEEKPMQKTTTQFPLFCPWLAV
jgi:hypothetical protein